MVDKGRGGLVVIGVLKLLKGLALLVVGASLLSLLHRDAAETVRQWVEFWRLDAHTRLVDAALAKLAGVTPRAMRELGLGTLGYAAVFCTEGIGLIQGRTWAEYLTTAVTVSFLPIEAYEMVSHPSLTKALVTSINLAVVAYLVREIRRQRQHAKGQTDLGPANG